MSFLPEVVAVYVSINKAATVFFRVILQSPQIYITSTLLSRARSGLAGLAQIRT